MIEDDLYAYLKNDAGISGYVAARIYPVKMPQNVEYPAITYQLVSTVRSISQSGRVTLVEGRYQIDSWGNTYASVKNIAQSVRDALQGFRGIMGATRVQGIWEDSNSERDFYEDVTDLRRVTHDFIIYYEEAFDEAEGGAGLVWTPQTSGTSEHLWGISGIGNSIRVASGENNVVARTVNGGSSWAINTSQLGFWENVHCRADGVCVLVGWKGGGGSLDNLKVSNNSGATWTPVDSGSPDDLYEVIYEPTTLSWLTSSLFLTGPQPYLRRAASDAAKWEEETHPFDNDLLAMASDGAGRVIMVGQNGLNGYSTDGGINWNQNANLTGAIQDCAHDPVTNNFIHVGAAGTLRYSTNGGITWQVATDPTTYSGSMRGVYVNDLGIAIVVGSNKTILRSTNGGVTYTVINETQLDTELLAVFHGGITWHAVGRSGTILTAQ